MAAILYFACPADHVCNIAKAPTAPMAPASIAKPVDPLAEFDDLPIASPYEARVSSVRGDVSPFFVSCDDLLPELIELATADEMLIHKTGRSLFSMPAPEDAPMIFQIQTRAK